MIETKVIICKDCLMRKTAFLKGTFGDGVQKRWVDEEGKLFNGKVCAGCNVKRVRGVMRKSRATPGT